MINKQPGDETISTTAVERERRSGDDRRAEARVPDGGRRETDLHITPSRLANYWGVHVDTVYRDIRKGALKAYRVGSGGQLRIRMTDARRYGKPVE
jgi:excisionase family DNA binding protein